MANKKITVLGDTADESLTPEEEHKIEVKIDKMLAPDDVSEQPEVAEDKPAEEPKSQKKSAKILVIDKSDEPVPETPPDPEQKTAPELPKKTPQKVKIAVSEHEDEPEEPVVETETPPTELVVEELPKKPLKIDIKSHDDEPTQDETEESPETEPEDAVPEEAAEAEPEEVPEAETVEPVPEEPEKQDESAGPEAETSPVKKYHPPDGPLPFKRAQPEQPASEIVDDISPKDSEIKPDSEDAAIAKAFESKPAGRDKRQRQALPKLFGAKTPRRVLLVLILALLVLAVALPKARAQVLNLAHVRSTLTVTVDDAKTHLPLAGVNIQAGTVSATTDQNGKATISDLRLGQYTLMLQKAGFATASKPLFIGWKTAGVNNLSLQETGVQYGFTVTDYVSDKPISTAEASGGSSRAQADAKGHIDFVVDAAQGKGMMVTISAAGYISTKVPLPASPATVAAVQLVPSGSDLYISKQAGLFDVYKADVDGQAVQELLAGTGSETSSMALVPSTDGSQAALVSTRDNQRDNAGYLLDTLTLINVATGAASSIDHGQQIKVVGWFGNRLVYTVLKTNAAASDPARYALVAYDVSAKKATELASANNFNDVVTADGAIYYATSNHFSGGESQLIKIMPDGSGKQVLLASEVANIFRTDYGDFILGSTASYYAYKIGDAKPVVTNSTYDGNGRLYVDAPDGKHSAWVDTATGQLSVYTKSSNTEMILVKQAGLTYPVRWLNANTIIYRISTTVGVSDYVVSINGGSAKKITSVIDMNGLNLWHD